ncbi:DUF3109 family protein [Ancylomarina euxinus]|uniref:DUF3109 family protein n=1 Tax=Ancylomarina euxinus TaxID=2283627 RepID=A0A425XYA1_9BACT|nr:DUF3109 family protein [Ancylomarina euxinus]MCZ4695837.1 DUF3109 family protein [Ancylomarina euxinus]MUP16099.1 DUF3109 family protein [Ancylomarina euxinus]RRG19820.1 DUF3109 family protein [Ancylomarina euxinus]
MLQIGNAIVSLDVIEKKFICDFGKCKGACCVEGDSGAPLDEDEKAILEEIYPDIKEYLTEKGIEEIEKQGTSVIDADGDLVTPIINDKECVYTVFENGLALCGIEKAFLDGKITYRKPISCSLYPIRIEKYPEFDAVNYNKWSICGPARELGFKMGTPVYKFLKDPLIRKYGEDWYNELEYAAENLEEIYQIRR